MRGVAETLVDQFADLCVIHLAGSDGRIEQVARQHPALARRRCGEPRARPVRHARRAATSHGEQPVRAHLRRPGRRVCTVSTTSSAARLQERGMSLVGHRADPGARPADGNDRHGDRRMAAAATGRPISGSSRSSPTAAPSPSSGRMLYSETRQAAVAAERRAEQLSRLIEAAISLNPSSSPSDLLVTLVDQATLVLQAPRAHAWLDGDDGFEAEIGERPSHGAARRKSARRRRAATRSATCRSPGPKNERFTAGDDAMLTLLAAAGVRGRAELAAVRRRPRAGAAPAGAVRGLAARRSSSSMSAAWSATRTSRPGRCSAATERTASSCRPSFVTACGA